MASAAAREREQKRRARLRAGIRCHSRFYEALARDVRAAAGAPRPRQRLARLLGEFGAPAAFKRIVGVSVSFEVNLRSRRPDCVCLLRLAAEGGAARAVCLIVELKTCRFAANMNTPSKLDQRSGGLRQLRDAARLVRDLAPPGPDQIMLAPVLVFVAQRGMRVLKVTRLPAQTIASNAPRLEAIIAGLAEHVPFASAGGRGARRQQQQRQQQRRQQRRRSPSPRPAPLPAAPPAGAPAGACLGAVAALFGGAGARR
ncbi:nuclear protein UL24 [Cervid alphaherpesvirus 2]|uniref:Protein UL24 homolog n=1 Tax=Cervid alphaherpesvirus 2 TaxID=365327 RepID=A0A455JN63_9ALPH|nr:nuclear protein UL24 [Cervid alphaherpesvirus 2]AVT50756.1 nuclear protein UL24 [Cervid alphaherpesvirus 2]